MGKKVWFGLVDLFLASLFVVSMYGCAAVQQALSRLDPGLLLSTQEVTTIS